MKARLEIEFGNSDVFAMTEFFKALSKFGYSNEALGEYPETEISKCCSEALSNSKRIFETLSNKIASSTEPMAAESQAAESQAAEPQAAEPQAAEPKPSHPETMMEDEPDPLRQRIAGLKGNPDKTESDMREFLTSILEALGRDGGIELITPVMQSLGKRYLPELDSSEYDTLLTRIEERLNG